MTYRKLPYIKLYVHHGEQDAIKFNNLIVAYWLNIICKHGGVSNCVIAISATLTSLSCLLAYLYFHLPEFIDPENWPANSQYLHLCNRSCIVRSSDTLII